MDHALRLEEWDRTANLMAAVVNSQRVKNPIKPDDVNPYRRAATKRRKPKKEESPLLMFL
jgi:hypothetical protein